MKHTNLHKRMKNKLPPILEVDEDGVPTFELDTWERRWASDGTPTRAQFGDLPIDIDD